VAFGTLTQTFDPSGNLLTQTDTTGTTTYTWDSRNRLASISGPTTSASFAYDALGRRVSKTINGVTTSYQYDGLDAIRESGADGEATYLRTLAIDEALSRTDDNATMTYLGDILGSTLALADASGAPVTTYTYAPFGETSVSGASSPNPYRFTGREEDGSGLYYYRARYYDPIRGRFVQEDPAALRGGDLNFYAYVGNGPAGFTDPLGLEKKCCQQGVMDCLGNCIEKERLDLANVAATAITTLGIGTMPKAPGELRGFGVPMDQLNPYTSQASRWTGRTGIRALREFGRSLVGRMLGGLATGMLVFEGFYDWGVIARCTIVCGRDACAY
jgi:RHS repeat-associated protein